MKSDLAETTVETEGPARPSEAETSPSRLQKRPRVDSSLQGNSSELSSAETCFKGYSTFCPSDLNLGLGEGDAEGEPVDAEGKFPPEVSARKATLVLALNGKKRLEISLAEASNFTRLFRLSGIGNCDTEDCLVCAPGIAAADSPRRNSSVLGRLLST